MKNSPFYKQAEMMLRVLPFVAKESCFALKGGTAINMFFRDLPRLSVDIDLVFLPKGDRIIAKKGINDALERIKQDLIKQFPGIEIREKREVKPSSITKLFVHNQKMQITIEPNLTLRGALFPCKQLELSKAAQELFGMYLAVNILSFEELYGGKICAALDRQHPRDFFDIKVLLENEGIPERLRKAFIVFLVSHNRPMNELLKPQLKNFKEIFESSFSGMTTTPVTYEQLVEARDNLISILHNKLTESERRFLISFKEGEPSWELLGLKGIEDLPGVRWKLQNILLLKTKNKSKHKNEVEKLKSVLEM